MDKFKNSESVRSADSLFFFSLFLYNISMIKKILLSFVVLLLTSSVSFAMEESKKDDSK